MYAGRKRIKVECVLYVDDYLWCVRWSQVDGFLAIVRELEARLGVLFDPIKEEGPSGALGFLGVWLDGQRRHIELTPQRVAESAALVASWLHPPALATTHFGVSELAKLAGSLTFTARALANARTFTRRIYEQLAAAEATPGFRGDKRRLPADLRADLEWFAAFLPTAADRPVPMISPDWDWDVDVIHSDATPAIGAGATLSRAPRASDHRRAPLSWFAHEWTDAERSGFERSRAMSANHAESLAAIMAIRAWGPSLRGRRILIHCDNAVTVAAWQSGYSRAPPPHGYRARAVAPRHPPPDLRPNPTHRRRRQHRRRRPFARTHRRVPGPTAAGRGRRPLSLAARLIARACAAA